MDTVCQYIYGTVDVSYEKTRLSVLQRIPIVGLDRRVGKKACQYCTPDSPRRSLTVKAGGVKVDISDSSLEESASL